MIAVDSSSLIAYLEGAQGPDVDLVDKALGDGAVVLPPPVLTEMLCAPKVGAGLDELLRELPLLEVRDGYWERAGSLRAGLLARNLKARLADSLIAQACLDHDVGLIARDQDFRHFVRAGLKLLP